MAGRAHLPPLTIQQILEWADFHEAYTGRWPKSRGGPLIGHPEITWQAINTALAKGARGLPGGDSLRRLLERKRGARHTSRLIPDLTRKKILDWADAHFQRTGQWPRRGDGPIFGGGGITWGTIDNYLELGNDHLPGSSSLARLLRESRSVVDGGKPILTTRRILQWAEEHFDATGSWPVVASGSLLKHPEETWSAINERLSKGGRGLPGGDSLHRLLKHSFGTRYEASLILRVNEVLRWADDHFRRKKRWPHNQSGVIAARPDLTWSAVDQRLRTGKSELGRPTTLRAVLDEHRRT